jgi:hypothetical protein
MVTTRKPSIAACSAQIGSISVTHTRHHHIGGALDAIHQGFAAAVEVVELALGHRVVDVDGREHQAAFLVHLVEAMHAGGGLLGDTADFLGHARVPARGALQLLLDGGVEEGFLLAARLGDQGGVLFGPHAQVHEQRRIPAVIQDHVGAQPVGELEDAVGVIPVVLQRLALDGEHRCARGGNGRGRMVLGGEDIARGPAHLGPQGLQGLDQHRRLDGHVQRAGDAGAPERLAGGVFPADGHQRRHLHFGNGDFAPAPAGQIQVSDLEVSKARSGLECGVHVQCSR